MQFDTQCLDGHDDGGEWVFAGNISARGLPWSPDQLRRIFQDALGRYDSLEIHSSGNSKELRRTGTAGLLIGRFRPTLYSFTQNRAGVVPGTDTLRLRISRLFWRELHRRNLKTCFLVTGSGHFMVTEERVAPVEVIVKRALVGTPAHIYHGLLEQTDRFGIPFCKGDEHTPYVRFDWRNPLNASSGERLRDEMLPSMLAERLIDTEVATGAALATTAVVDEVLAKIGVRMLDMCLFLDQSGAVICGEISPDNMRIKNSVDGGDLDKDLWRKGRPAEELITRWTSLLTRLEGAHGSDRDCC